MHRCAWCIACMLACSVAGAFFLAVKAIDDSRGDDFVQAGITRCTWVCVRGVAFAWQEIVDCLALNDITEMSHMGDAKFDAVQGMPVSAGKQVCRCAVYIACLALRRACAV